MASYAFLGVRYRTSDGGPANIKTYPEAASQSFKAGDYVDLSSGKVEVAFAASGTYSSADMDGATILGMAINDATGTTDSPVKVVIADDRTEFLVPVVHATPASAVTAVTQHNMSCDLAHYTLSGVTSWGAAIDDTAGTNTVRIVDLDDSYPVGEQYGRVWIKVLVAARTLG